MNADGEIDWEVARAKLPSDVTQEQADQVHNACKDISKYNSIHLIRANINFYPFIELILYNTYLIIL